MITAVKIQNIKFYPGAHAGLSGKTALLTLLFDDFIGEWPVEDGYLRDQAMHLLPGEPLFAITGEEWPDAFLVAPVPAFSLARWIVALTIAFQRWARDPVVEGRVMSVSDCSIILALPWEREQVFISALQLALDHLLFWAMPGSNSGIAVRLAKELDGWLIKVRSGGLSPNSLRFALAASKRRIPVSVSASTGTLRLGWGINALRLDSSFTSATGVLAARIARNKFQTIPFLQLNGVPVPPGSLVLNREQAITSAMQLGWPVVVKPCNQDQGAGVIPGICDKTTLFRAFDEAFKFSPRGVIVEKHVKGEDYRMLVVGGKLLITTRRIPAGVTGDGKSSVADLVREVNADPLRGKDKRSMLIRLTLDDEAARCLRFQSLAAESLPEAGRFVRLRLTANLSTGGTAEDVTALVHPDNRMVAERAARLIGLDIAGIDFLCPDIAKSLHEVGDTDTA